MRTRCLVLLLTAASAAIAADEFDRVTKAVEFHYSVRRTHIPMMGLANLVVKVAHPAGAKNFRLAIFENLLAEDDPGGIDRIVHELAGKGLRPAIRAQSRRSGESTLIFAREAGTDMQMVVAAFGRNEATVIQVTVDVETFMKTLDEPLRTRDIFHATTSSNR
jgi:hypothetical protein